MEITVVNDSQARLGLDVREVKIMQHIFAEVKDVLNHEAEFETRVGGYYIETQELITSLSNNFIASLNELRSLEAYDGQCPRTTLSEEITAD
jgi:hypothetical protein